MSVQNQIKQFGIGSILVYHLFPGIPILFISIILSNPVWGMGLPIFLSLMLAILFGLIPTQLGILLITARRETKKILDVISFTEKMSTIKTVFWAIPLLFISIIVFMIVAGMEHSLWSIFNWVPEWFRLDRFSAESSSQGMIYLMLILGFILNGVLGPLVEELYFRGFLLPRMNRLGKWSPFVNVVLFSLYHFFTPWENITRILALIPFVYAVWYKENIYIGIIVHIALNVGGMIMMAISVLS